MFDNRERIRSSSRKLRVILHVIFYTMPLVNGLVWFFINQLPPEIYYEILPHHVTMPLPVSARLLSFMVVMIPTGVAMIGVRGLMRLFSLYEVGKIFHIDNVRCFKMLSRVLLWWFAAGIIHRSLLSVALTLHNPPGQRMITLDLSSADLTALLLGGILAVIAWVMEEGRILQEEQDLTV